jgi:hypothetical protein
MGNTHCIEVFINIPLKTADSYFTLYKIIALLARVLNDKLIQYLIDIPYFGLNHNQRDYILLTEADFCRCTESITIVCPANMVIYSSETLT